MSLINDLRKYVIRPTLYDMARCQLIVDFTNPSLEILLAGTIQAETNCNYLKEIGGPALDGNGLYQIDNQSHIDVVKWLNYPEHALLAASVLHTSNMFIYPKNNEPLIYNLRYATIVARLIYHRAKEQLPAPNDAVAMAQYHKEHYNTSEGKADAGKNVAIFKGIIDAKL